MGKNIDVINMFIDQVAHDTKKKEPINFIHFVQNVVESVPETSVFAHVPIGDNMESHPMESCTMRMRDRVKDNLYAESENFTAFLIAKLNTFIKDLSLSNKAKGLGNYQAQCVMDEDNSPQVDWKKVKEVRSQRTEDQEKKYQQRHDEFRNFQLTGLILKNKGQELGHWFHNLNNKDPQESIRQANEGLKLSFYEVNRNGGWKFGDEIKVLVDNGANIFQPFFNVTNQINESIIDNVIQSNNFHLLAIMSQSNQLDHNGHSVLD